MQKKLAWKLFSKTGKISHYLLYKAIEEEWKKNTPQ